MFGRLQAKHGTVLVPGHRQPASIGAPAAAGGPALEGFEEQPAGGGVLDDELAVEDQVLGRLPGNGVQDREPASDEGAAPGLQKQSAAVACGAPCTGRP
ncbi:hypothetical protein OG756_41020 [Streptomyces sp. NBC_01310]|uniref:hypothetical protein n=1 Tax=Streptomyces sp. NBC_01310 TaxID=2903820 RepID=UPI0035B5F776|nr:hypothetical protein OG756_00370 [Streptomyces sp. NBC_01310]WSJ63793.1 hypothetical protein OG756_41020 [Streptomyces sp. NBC_01310]